MAKMFCALGCSPTKNLFVFPSRKHDIKRRKLWLDFFDMEEPNTAAVFACDKHFSPLQTTNKGILQPNAVPDISTICSVTVYPFRRKPKNWRQNVIVVTPRDPEFNIYRHETGVFPENLFGNVETTQSVIQTPIIKSVSCSMSTQTNIRICGLIQISDIKEEYSLNCFYCSEAFPIEKWPMFIYHLRNTHFQKEKAFKMSKILLQDHNYTATCPPNDETKVTSPNNFKTVTNSLPILPTALQKQNLLQSRSPIGDCIYKMSEELPSELAKSQQSTDKTFNVSVADQVIKLLNETLLSPKFVQTDDDNIIVIKNTGSDNIEASMFLKNLMNLQGDHAPYQKIEANDHLKKSHLSSSTSKYSRPVYTISDGLKDIPSRRCSISQLLFPPLPKNKKLREKRKRFAQQTLKNINVFENIYKTVKTRYPKVVDVTNLNEPGVSNKVSEQQIPKLTPLSRCLKRTNTETTETIKVVPNKSTEIVFEYTPRDIVISLLENMKMFPVLWEFHEQPFNKDYNRAIEKLCRTINDKWSLNITMLKMRRSINRILRFYRFILPSESIDEFEEYFDKCAFFLPSSTEEIPRARCAYCCVCYKKDIDLRKHILIQHKSLKWPFKCKKCFERFRECDEYELHKRLPHYVEIFKCEVCLKRFNRRHLYNKHISSHEKTKERRLEANNLTDNHLKFWCDLCKKTFPDLKRHIATRHVVTHRIKQVFKCHLCPKEFATKVSLKMHIKRHNKKFDYVCEICGKGFILKSCLNEHMNKHTGDKITCNICNLKLRKCNLLRHLRLVHIVAEGTIESTFRAKSHRYQKYVSPRQPYKRTREEAPRRYNCKICNLLFVRLKLLKDHNKQVHSDVKKVTCQLCPIDFIHLQNLKRHYREKHKLHAHQVFMLVDQKEDLNKVLAMKADELNSLNPFGHMNNTNTEVEEKESTSYFNKAMMHSNEIQDEIMKAVENLDKQEIRVDDDQSMNKFFTDLLKH